MSSVLIAPPRLYAKAGVVAGALAIESVAAGRMWRTAPLPVLIVKASFHEAVPPISSVWLLRVRPSVVLKPAIADAGSSVFPPPLSVPPLQSSVAVTTTTAPASGASVPDRRRRFS